MVQCITGLLESIIKLKRFDTFRNHNFKNRNVFVNVLRNLHETKEATRLKNFLFQFLMLKNKILHTV